MTMIRKAEKRDIQAIVELLHQVDMVHHVIRPDLFKPNTTKYNELELETLLEDEWRPVFVYDDGKVLGHAFCQITEVRDDKLLQDIKTLYIDDICVDEQARAYPDQNRPQNISSIYTCRLQIQMTYISYFQYRLTEVQPELLL